MVVITNNSVRVYIDAKYLHFSPYLYGQYHINERLEKESDPIIIEDVYDDDLLNYLSFLKGEEFAMDERAESFFDYMGHCNTMEYPLDYWKVKLRSRWIRHNFYRLELWRDPFYGLVKIPIPHIHPKRLPLDINFNYEDTGVVIAGGYVLFLMGAFFEYSDVDTFSTDKEKSMKWFFDIPSYINATYQAYNTYVPYLGCKLSLIRRVYRSPAEVVHGFDLDSCQFLAIVENGEITIYGTEIGVYALRNMVNWLDPDMASTTYLQRLGKYQERGFQLRLPLITIDDIDLSPLHGYSPLFGPHLVIEQTLSPYMIYHSSIGGSVCKYRELVRERNAPHDLGSILIYIAFGNLRVGKVIYSLLTADRTQEELAEMQKTYSTPITELISRASDPDITDEERSLLEEIILRMSINDGGIIDILSLPWIEVDPMSQGELTGVMYPIKYDNLVDIYRRSPLYIGTRETE